MVAVRGQNLLPLARLARWTEYNSEMGRQTSTSSLAVFVEKLELLKSPGTGPYSSELMITIMFAHNRLTIPN